MRQVINHGTNYKICKCERCGCEFWYDFYQDTWVEDRVTMYFKGRIKFVRCPDCNCANEVEVKKED